MSHSVWVIQYESSVSQINVTILREFREQQKKWLLTYKIQKKSVHRSNDHFEANNYFNYNFTSSFSSRPIKPSHLCHICGKKNDSRRQMEKHVNSEHKIKCSVKGCPKLFFKPTDKNQERYLIAVENHHAAKHGFQSIN